VKWLVCSSLFVLEVVDLLYLVRSQNFPQTFSSIRKTSLNDFEGASKDDQIFHNSLMGLTLHLVLFNGKRYLSYEISNNTALRNVTDDLRERELFPA
jgi:hypothetical protein